jgi:RNA polymerase sigma-70 factor (ECF subfamily)
MSEPSDPELVRAFRSGDRSAFETLVGRHQDRVFRLVHAWLHDPQLAEDATQEVFMRAFRGLKGFRYRAEPFTWLYRTARHVCAEFNRRRRWSTLDQAPALFDSRSPNPADGVVPANDFENLPDSGGDETAIETIEREHIARQLRKLIAVLPTRQREVVMLRVFEEMSVRETAAAMGCREGTVKALLHKAMGRLRREAAGKGWMG